MEPGGYRLPVFNLFYDIVNEGFNGKVWDHFFTALWFVV